MYSREKHFRQENPKPKKSHRNTPSFSSSLLDEICRSIDEKPDPKTPQAAAVSKVEKWMENDRTAFRRRQRSDNAVFPDNDTSTSSSADAELPANRPKPVRTAREKDSYLFDEYEEHERRHRAAERDDHLIKSKSRAMRIYANLKKMKQPISPGAKLTSFFASIFSGLNRRKSRGAAAAESSPAKSIEIERRLQLDLARVLVDRMPRGHKTRGDGRPPLPPNALQNRGKCDLNKSRYKRDDDEDEDENDGDAISESSSDLFELDHSSLFAIKDRLCEELPVYETTYFHKNRRLFR